MQASNQGFFDVVAQRLGAAALTAEQLKRVLDATARPLRRAQEAGAVRADLVPEDVQLMLRMVGATTRPAPDGSPMDDHWPRYLGLLLDATRPGAATPLPAEARRLGPRRRSAPPRAASATAGPPSRRPRRRDVPGAR